jgi:protein phosphatase/serine/threonine-protein phosphatase Stp1
VSERREPVRFSWRSEQPLVLRSAALSHVGCVRAVNEDRSLQRDDIGLWAVADGMGGHSAGDVASSLVIDALSGIRPPQSDRALFDDVLLAMRETNEDLRRRATDMRAGSVIGSTVVVLLAREAHYACLWAGDSRAYLLRDAALKQLTRDHSLVQQLIDDGRLEPSRVKDHPRANIITRAVGAAEHLELDSCHAALQAGDTFLLCSDGLSNTLGAEELRQHLSAPSLEAGAAALLELSLQRMARDNVTLVLVRAACA